MKTPDKEGRLPLSRAEYIDLRNVFAAVNLLEIVQDHGSLQDRIRGQKYGWQRWRLLLWAAEWLLSVLLHSIPQEKRHALTVELKSMRAFVYVSSAAVQVPEDHVTVPREPLNEICNQIQTTQCCLCQKTGKKAKNCKTRRMLRALVPWDVETEDPERAKMDCPLKWGEDEEIILDPGLAYDEDPSVDYIPADELEV